MTNGSTPDSQAVRRSWVALLYFYVAALVGLGFVVTGTTMALFGAKSALFPGLGVPRYAYEVSQPYETYPGRERIGPSKSDGGEPGRTNEAERQRQEREAKARAVAERRSNGFDGILNGLIIAGVGAPVLLWHLKRGRALGAGTERADAAGTSPAPTPPAAPPAAT